jgi:protein MpaA
MLAALAAFAVSLLALPEATPTPTTRDVALLGYSAERRPIRAVVVGERSAPLRVLVVGCIHGNECAGVAVTRRLARAPAPDRSVLWVVHRLNPDGAVLGVRQNARGVDLNRNFPAGWRPSGRRWDAEHSGPRPLSEPETRAARRLVVRVRPEVTVWFHQPQGVVRAWGRSVPAARRYARLAGMPFRRIPWPPGTAPNWQNHRFPGTSSFVVELPSGPLSHREAARHVRAARRLL